MSLRIMPLTLALATLATMNPDPTPEAPDEASGDGQPPGDPGLVEVENVPVEEVSDSLDLPFASSGGGWSLEEEGVEEGWFDEEGFEEDEVEDGDGDDGDGDGDDGDDGDGDGDDGDGDGDDGDDDSFDYKAEVKRLREEAAERKRRDDEAERKREEAERKKREEAGEHKSLYEAERKKREEAEEALKGYREREEARVAAVDKRNEGRVKKLPKEARALIPEGMKGDALAAHLDAVEAFSGGKSKPEGGRGGGAGGDGDDGEIPESAKRFASKHGKDPVYVFENIPGEWNKYKPKNAS